MFIPITIFKRFLERLVEVTPFRIPRSRFFIYGIITGLIFILLYILGNEIRENYVINAQTIIAFVQSAGIFSYIVFALIVALTVMSPLPSSTLGLIGGYLFTPITSIALILVGEVLGASVNFAIGKHIIRPFLTKEKFPVFFSKIETYKTYITGRNVFFLALIPVGTANITGYTSGLIQMRYKTFILSWTTGIMTLSILTTYLGHSAHQQNITLSVILAVIILLFLFFGRKYAKHLTKRLQKALV